jgi:hypothetical protein
MQQTYLDFIGTHFGENFRTIECAFGQGTVSSNSFLAK